MKKNHFILLEIRKTLVIIVFIMIVSFQVGISQTVTNGNDNSSQTNSILNDTISNDKAAVATKLQAVPAVSAEKQNVAAPVEKIIVAVSKSVTGVNSQKLVLIKNDTVSKNNELIAIPEAKVKTKIGEE